MGGHLNRVVPIFDNAGNVASHVLKSFMVELKWWDVTQIIIGASLLSILMGFTDETWHMGEILPFPNVLLLALISILFLSVFILISTKII